MDGLRGAVEPRKRPQIDRVLQDSSIYFLGNIASRVVGFFAIPFYARFLNPAQYGLIELIELSTQTIAIALGLQAIGAALSRLFHDQTTPEGEQAVVSTSLIATAVLSAVVTIAAVAGARLLSELVFHSDEWTSLLRAAFIAMFFSNMIEVVLVYERIRANARFFLIYTLVTLSLNLALNILFIGELDAGVWGFVSSKLVVTVGGSLYLMLRMRRTVGWHWRSLYVPELVRFGAPLVLSSLSYFAIHFSDRFFLSSAVSLADLGRYALAYKFAILVSALVGDSFAKSWNTTLYRYTDKDGWRAQFARIASYFTYLLFATGLAIALFSPELLRIMVPQDYLPPPLLLPIIIASYLAREIGDFFRSLLLINKRSVRVSQIAGAGAIVNLLANLIFIPPFGIYGAAVATLVTWFLYMVVCWIIANREHRLPVRVDAYVRISLLVVAVYAMGSTTRTHGFVGQVVMDSFWLAVFCFVALITFFSAEERRGAFAMAGSIVLWLAVRRVRWSGGEATSEPNVLMLAYYYPPQNEIGAARPGRFARYLRRAGVDVTVITSFGRTPAPKTTGGEVYVTRASPPIGRSAQATAQTASIGGDSGFSWRIRAASTLIHFGERLFLPYDDRLGWLPYAFDAACDRVGPGTVLFSTHPPTVTHMTALAMKRRHDLPWIADFRDPLWGNPYRTSERAALMDPLVEQMTMEGADAVIANTDASAEVLRNRYPEMSDKVHVIWNGFDPEEVLVPRPHRRGRRQVLAHVGTLYGNRTLLPILLSIERLIEGGRLDHQTIQVRQVGRADPSCLNLADPGMEALSAQGCVHVVNQNLPQRDAQDEMLNAAWLLLLDMNAVNPGLQVPAKTFEYVRAGRPILALTVPGSSTERVLALSGVSHACIDVNAEPEMFDAAVLEFLSRPIVSAPPNDAFWLEFSAPNQVEHLIRIIDAVRDGGRDGIRMPAGK